MSALSKVFEKVISEEITEFLDQNKLFSTTQFGFRSNISTTDALLFATETIRHEVDNDGPVSAALLDLSKAFDSISHKYLPRKLKDLNFEVPALSIIQSYLTNRIQKVVQSTT